MKGFIISIIVLSLASWKFGEVLDDTELLIMFGLLFFVCFPLILHFAFRKRNDGNFIEFGDWL